MSRCRPCSLPSRLWRPIFPHGELRGSVRLSPCGASEPGVAGMIQLTRNELVTFAVLRASLTPYARMWAGSRVVGHPELAPITREKAASHLASRRTPTTFQSAYFPPHPAIIPHTPASHPYFPALPQPPSRSRTPQLQSFAPSASATHARSHSGHRFSISTCIATSRVSIY
jgi:hypothetical protein